MSIERQLGVEHPHTPTLTEAARRWPVWTAHEPDLAVVDDLVDLRDWSQQRDPRTNDVLRALVRLGSPTGGDEPLATTVLTWLLVQGAANIARSMADLSPVMDQLVASHLWTAAREYDWTRPTGVAGSILRQTRRGVQAELGVGEGARRAGWVRDAVRLIEPTTTFWDDLIEEDPADVDPEVELLELLADASAAGVLSADDRQLLVDLAIAAQELQKTSATRIRQKGSAGLLSRAAKQQLADARQVDARTIGRRATRSLARLHAFATSENFAAA